MTTSLLAIGTGKGLFLARSDDDRRTWTVSDPHFPMTGVYAVAFDVVDLPPSSAWPTLGLIAAFSAGAFVAMVGGLQLVGAVRNSIIGILEALTVAVLAVVFLDEPITWATATGGVLILVGAIIATTIRTTRSTEPNV